MIWIPLLPYLRDYGNRLTRRFLRRIAPLLIHKCDFIINWKTTNINSIVSSKDKTPLYQFSCPGCKASYIGKTERCLISTQELKNMQETTNQNYLITLRLVIISNTLKPYLNCTPVP